MKPNITLVFLLTITTSATAQAYLDPGAGSLILQMVIAGIVGALFTIKMYWLKLKQMVLRWFGKEIHQAEDEVGDEQKHID